DHPVAVVVPREGRREPCGKGCGGGSKVAFAQPEVEDHEERVGIANPGGTGREAQLHAIRPVGCGGEGAGERIRLQVKGYVGVEVAILTRSAESVHRWVATSGLRSAGGGDGGVG